MLGCHDFCGYYDWTFHHVRQTFGPEALRTLWSEAIGGESQQAYSEAARRAGLQGLLETWTKTGEDEHCDWTFTHDAQKNVLRWDMRQCPSKGYLIDNDLNAAEDYCDHCIGWIAPLLEKVGIELAEHQHNHRGQCWAELRVKGLASESLDLPSDIRKDARWREGYIHCFVAGQPTDRDVSEVLLEQFSDVGAIRVGQNLLTDIQWLDSIDSTPRAIIVGDDPQLIGKLTAKWRDLPREARPLLLHAYFPRQNAIDFPMMGLARPLPILPLLIRTGTYVHSSGGPRPSVIEQAHLFAQAIVVLRDHAKSEGARIAASDLTSRHSGT